MNKWPGLLTLLGLLMMTTAAKAGDNTAPWEHMELVGKGKLSVLFWDIYNAELYTADGSYQEAQYPIALKLQYLRNFSKQELISETEKQWKKLGFKDQEKIAGWLATLDEMWQDVNENDAITLYIDADRCSYFYFNYEQLGRISDPEFASAFLDIWLSENTSAPAVRRKLIS